MKASRSVQTSILRRLEAHEYPIHRFREFSEHEIGGFEESKSPDWTDEEAYNIRQLIHRGLLVESFSNGDEPWLGLSTPGSAYRESYIEMTPEAHDWLEQVTFSGKVKRQLVRLRENFITIVVSVLTAWLLTSLGLNK